MNFSSLFTQTNKIISGLLYQTKNLNNNYISFSDDEIDFIETKNNQKLPIETCLLVPITDCLLVPITDYDITYNDYISTNYFNYFYDDLIFDNNFIFNSSYKKSNNFIFNSLYKKSNNFFPIKLFDISNKRYNIYTESYGISNNKNQLKYNLHNLHNFHNLHNLHNLLSEQVDNQLSEQVDN